MRKANREDDDNANYPNASFHGISDSVQAIHTTPPLILDPAVTP